MPAIKRCLFVVFLVALVNNLQAQEKPSAFKLFFEKVYLHADRDLYAQGDTIWYKAYLVNAQNNMPIGTSGNLYVELIQQDSAKIISKQIIRLDYGAGNGDISLSDSLPSGKYQLRAYTNWMRNFGDNFIFEKGITIINTAEKKAATITSYQNKASKLSLDLNTKFRSAVSGPVIRFFPESGSLIEGVSSIVAVKAEDRAGKGIPARGAVINSSGDTVAHFTCDTLGMGLFVMGSESKQVYRAEVTSKQKKRSVELPQPLTKGFAIRVKQTDSLLNVVISCNDATLADAKGKIFTLTGKHGGKTCFSKQIQITDVQLLIRIDNAIFPDGITAITLTDDQNKPNCERLVYVHHSTNSTVDISTDKPGYQPKEKVMVHIKTSPKTNLSMAVVDASIVPVQAESIEAYLMLRSEVRGEIEQPCRYFDTTNVSRFKQLDQLLMTQGWRDFVWRRLADTAIRISYKAEDGIDIMGKLQNEKSDNPLPGMNVTLYASAAKGVKLLSSTTDASGKFSFPALLYYGEHPVKLSAVNAKGEKNGAFSIDTVPALPIRPWNKQNISDPQADTTTQVYTATVKRQADIKAVSLKGAKNLKEVKITASRAFITKNGNVFTSWGPDQVFDITPKDLQFKTLEWFVLQKVKGAVQSNEDTITGPVIPGIDTMGYVVILPNGTATRQYRAHSSMLPPQFVINGVDYYTENNIEAEAYRTTYYPLAIEKFKRIVVRHVAGTLVNLPMQTSSQAAQTIVDRYIIYLTLKDDAMIGYNPGVLRPAVNGYYTARTFYKPLYGAQKDISKPDYRSTIHWEPNITTDAKGEATISFYNADPKTTVSVIVEGLKATGGAVVGSATYTVK